MRERMGIGDDTASHGKFVEDPPIRLYDFCTKIVVTYAGEGPDDLVRSLQRRHCTPDVDDEIFVY